MVVVYKISGKFCTCNGTYLSETQQTFDNTNPVQNAINLRFVPIFPTVSFV